MMSLSAGSPILRWHHQETNAAGIVSIGKGKETVQSTINGGGKNCNQKVTMNSINQSETKSISQNIQSSEENWRLPSPAFTPVNSKTKHSSKFDKNTEKTANHDAHLLLAFSHSPEILRPTSAIRQTFDQSNSTHHSHQRRLSFTPSMLPQRRKSVSPITEQSTTNDVKRGLEKLLRTSKTVNGRSIVLDSAPGGAHPSSSISSLPSPPLFALDEMDVSTPSSSINNPLDHSKH